MGRKYLGFNTYKKSNDLPPADKVHRLGRFKDAAFRASVQLLFTIQLLICTLPHPWFYDHRQYFPDHCTGIPCRETISFGQRLTYLVELSFYIQDIPFLFSDHIRQKDRLELFAHHIATITLLGYSYWMGFTKVGVVVLLCHEPKEILYFIHKMVRCVPNIPENVTTATYLAFLAVWFATSVFAFGAVIFRCGFYEGYRWASLHGITPEPHGVILNGLCIFLFVLHVYWSYLFLGIAVRLLRKGKHQHLENTWKMVVMPERKHNIILRMRRGGIWDKKTEVFPAIEVVCGTLHGRKKNHSALM